MINFAPDVNDVDILNSTRPQERGRDMGHRRKRLLVLVATCVQLISCGRPSMSINPTAPVLKIAVASDGRITVDGSPATLQSVRVSLKRLADQKGVVWYYREAGETEAPPESTEVMKAVIENRLPIRLSSRPDFSDAIDPDGRPVTKGSH